jgi:hypothetical protein
MFEKNVLQPVARNSHLKNAYRSMLTNYLKYKVKTPQLVGAHFFQTSGLLLFEACSSFLIRLPVAATTFF